MTKQEFATIFTPYLVAMQARDRFDAPTNRAYFRVLQDVPAPLFEAAIERLMGESRTFIPKAGEIKALCDQERRAIIAAHPHEGCVDCESSRGWREVRINGAAYVERCPCWSRHWEKLSALGVPARPLALPAVVEES